MTGLAARGQDASSVREKNAALIDDGPARDRTRLAGAGRQEHQLLLLGVGDEGRSEERRVGKRVWFSPVAASPPKCTVARGRERARAQGDAAPQLPTSGRSGACAGT